jgi:hypothetical protein
VANIPDTVIGTSDPPNICTGFYLFEDNKRAFPLGITAGQTLIAISPQILAWIFNASAGYKVFIGQCGPSYALRFNAQGETSGNEITLNVSNDATQAGFFVGFDLELFVNFSIQQWTIHWVSDGWHSHFTSDWETVLTKSLNVTFDLVQLIVSFILAVLQEQGDKDTLLEKVDTALPGVTSSWGMFDSRSNQFAANNGTLNVNPGFMIPINLVPLTEALPPPLDLPFLINEALEALWGDLEMGPQVTLSIPVQVKLTNITVDNQTYGNLQFQGGQVTGTGGQETANPKNLGVTLSQSPGFDIELGVFADVCVLKLFNLSGSANLVDLANLLGIHVSTGPFTDSLSTPVGGNPGAGTMAETPSTIASGKRDGTWPGENGLAFFDRYGELAPSPVEVVFDPPEFGA